MLTAFPKLAPTSNKPITEASDPRAVVVIGGNFRTSPETYSIKINAHGATNSATITMPISSNPDFSKMLARGSAAGKILPFSALEHLPASTLSGLSQQSQASQQATTVAIYAGLSPNGPLGSTNITPLSKRFTGIVDSYSAAVHGDLITFQCQSAASVLYDTKVTHISLNQPTVDFMAKQCARFSLKFVHDPNRTYGTVQQVLAYDQVGGSGFAAALHGKRIWDLMLECALFDDVDLFEHLGTIYYQSPLTISRNHIALRWLSNIAGLTLSHSIQQNKSIQVQVHGNVPRSRLASTSRLVVDAFGVFTRTPVKISSTTSSAVMGTPDIISTSPNGTTTVSQAAGGSFTGTSTGGARESNLQKYEFWVHQPPAICDLLAAAYARQISMHEYAVSLEVPMTKDLLSRFSITSLLELRGTPYAYFNDEFWPREYTETFSADTGFTLSIEAVNHSLASEAAV